jgi:hypothetical protein
MAQRFGTYHPRYINRHVPSCSYASDVLDNGPFIAKLGAPVAASANGILNDQSIASASETTTLLEDTLDAEYGRNVTVIASGAATSTVTVYGRDYLGQPMLETLTLNGNNTVAGKKAFKWIDRVAYGATAATTIDLGWGDVLGLPYKAHLFMFDMENNAAVTDGTLVVGVDTQTATSADPRGTYDPNSACDGSKSFSVMYVADRSNLHGAAHYFA